MRLSNPNQKPPEQLELTAQMDIELRADAGDGKPKLPRFSMVAYTGGPMRVGTLAVSGGRGPGRPGDPTPERADPRSATAPRRRPRRQHPRGRRQARRRRRDLLHGPGRAGGGRGRQERLPLAGIASGRRSSSLSSSRRTRPFW